MHEDEFTLEELAAAAGMTARNVRAYQTKGLIPPPARSGRRSVYRAEHLRRLGAIERARRLGASLSLIATHLAAGRELDDDTLVNWHDPPVPGTGGSTGDVVDLTEPGPDPARRPGPDPGPDPDLGTDGEVHDITPLLDGAGPWSDEPLAADVHRLVAAGVLHADGNRIRADPQLATGLAGLRRHDFPMQAALRTASGTLAVGVPLTAVLRDVADLGDVPEPVLVHLVGVVAAVTRQLLVRTSSDLLSTARPLDPSG